jgi:type IV fimbrial biogenesis protein FimT
MIDCRRARGMTLIELLTALAIVAIFATLGTPSFIDFMKQIRLSAKMNELSSDLYLARSESIKRNSRVLVCSRASASSKSCATAPAAGTWMNGWLVCYDANADGVCDATSASDPNPIRTHEALSAPISLSGPAAAVVFLPVGNAVAPATFTMTGSTSTTRTASVTAAGSIKVVKS